MIIMKFGGTSVGTVTAIQNVINIVKARLEENPCVVVSAMGGVTDKLLKAGELASTLQPEWTAVIDEVESRHRQAAIELLSSEEQQETLSQIGALFLKLRGALHGVFLVQELTPKTADFISGFGERLSILLVAGAFRSAGVPAQAVDSGKLIVTDQNFGNARILEARSFSNLRQALKNPGHLPIVAGFIAATEKGEPTTLGRGGSDYTAALVAAALEAKSLEIWTDVDGVLTTDPRKVKQAFSIPSLSYEELMELSHFGAKVIYPPTIHPVMAVNIPIFIKNTFNPDHPGTLISTQPDQSAHLLRGLSSIEKIALLSLQGSGLIGVAGIAGRLFSALSRAGVSVILISQASSEHSISFALVPGEITRATAAINQEFALEQKAGLIEPVKLEEELSIVAAVGENMRQTPGIAGRIFSALGRNGVNVVAIAQGSSELNISFVVRQAQLVKALNVLHDAFFLTPFREVHVYLAGTGLVGKAFIRQLISQSQVLMEKHRLFIKVMGVVNSRWMAISEEPMALEGLPESPPANARPADLTGFVKEIIQQNLPNSVFIDNTASEAVAKTYFDLLNASISVITPNKTACSWPWEDYVKLKETAVLRGVRFLFETNVGAGLPVINTLNDLVKSGDRVTKIEAILSGTLNFICNRVNKDLPLSKAVALAKEAGFTEPDPRLDLSGTDVARKILILSREAGYRLELSDVNCNSFLPVSLDHLSMEEFWKQLPEQDAWFEDLFSKAEQEGKRLRFIASMDNGKTSAALQAVDASHPFYHLEGKENCVAYSTLRYDEKPLVIRGAGAGAEVTAAGIFGDLIRFANI